MSSRNYRINDSKFGFVQQYGFHAHYSAGYRIALDPARVIILHFIFDHAFSLLFRFDAFVCFMCSPLKSNRNSCVISE